MTLKTPSRPAPFHVSLINTVQFNDWAKLACRHPIKVDIHSPLRHEASDQVNLPFSGQAAFERLMSQLELQLRELAMIRTGGELNVEATAQRDGNDLILNLMLGEGFFHQQQLTLHLKVI